MLSFALGAVVSISAATSSVITKLPLLDGLGFSTVLASVSMISDVLSVISVSDFPLSASELSASFLP